MASSPLQVQMLGDFAIRNGSAEINSSNHRSRKILLLLAYIIYNRNTLTPYDKFIQLLWGEDETVSNPNNSLKTMFHRVKTYLSQLGDDAGRTFIIHTQGTYTWNNSIPIRVDIDEFEALCKAGAAAENEEEKISHYLAALSLYRGDFLQKLSSDMWVVPIATYYHNLYMQTVMAALPLMDKHERYQDAVDLCNAALVHEPYEDALYAHLMQSLLKLGNKQAAAKVYENMSQLMLSTFGVMPSDSCLALYREAIHTENQKLVPSGVILEQLRECQNSMGGALFCDYDVFKHLYHFVARSVARSGYAVHLMLLSVTAKNDAELPKRSLDRVIDNLQLLLCSSLRRGDIVSRCSVSQFIIMLPQANYENSQMVCDRLLQKFARQYPHSPAYLHASIHPLDPNP